MVALLSTGCGTSAVDDNASFAKDAARQTLPAPRLVSARAASAAAGQIVQTLFRRSTTDPNAAGSRQNSHLYPPEASAVENLGHCSASAREGDVCAEGTCTGCSSGNATKDVFKCDSELMCVKSGTQICTSECPNAPQ
jgi:hypothetical protein